MSKFMNFMKTTAIGGLLVIVPVAIVLFVLAQIFYALYSLTQSLTTDLGLQTDDALIMVGIAVASLIGLCFLTGLIVQTRIGLAVRNWMPQSLTL
jgi:uncharacterized membrane protein